MALYYVTCIKVQWTLSLLIEGLLPAAAIVVFLQHFCQNVIWNRGREKEPIKAQELWCIRLPWCIAQITFFTSIFHTFTVHWIDRRKTQKHLLEAAAFSPASVTFQITQATIANIYQSQSLTQFSWVWLFTTTEGCTQPFLKNPQLYSTKTRELLEGIKEYKYSLMRSPSYMIWNNCIPDSY